MSSMPQAPERREPSSPPCTRYPLSFFFAPDGEGESRSLSRPTDAETAALKVCAECPIARRRTCLEAALIWGLDHQHGVIGGSTAVQRKAIIRGRAAERLVLAGVA